VTALAEARHAAEYLRRLFEPYCERVEIAGSIRRRAPEVKDIELVAVPLVEQVQTGLFGGVYDVSDHLEQRVAEGVSAGWLAPRDVDLHRKDGTVEQARRMGTRYKALVYDGIAVDLFVVRPPADWGVVFTIRTGPADFSEALVTACQAKLMRVEHGQLLRMGRPVPCPEERDFFRELGQPWLEPWERRADRVARAA
jgi:DNA polymerase/3'-5' exonuclease PolX